MDEMLRATLKHLGSEDRELQNAAFFTLLETTDKPVDWANFKVSAAP